MNIDLQMLRELFYVKIPERLFYGMTRNLDSGTKIKLFVDANEEYEKMELYKKLKEQMNTHSAYRNKCYQIIEAIPLDSIESIPLQLIDTVMGIVVFVLEKSYEDESGVSTVKSGLIYRFLIEKDNLSRLQHNITLYRWGEEEDHIEYIPISALLKKSD